MWKDGKHNTLFFLIVIHKWINHSQKIELIKKLIDIYR